MLTFSYICRTLGIVGEGWAGLGIVHEYAYMYIVYGYSPEEDGHDLMSRDTTRNINCIPILSAARRQRLTDQRVRAQGKPYKWPTDIRVGVRVRGRGHVTGIALYRLHIWNRQYRKRVRFSCLWQAIKKASTFKIARANHPLLANVKGSGYRQSIDASCLCR